MINAKEFADKIVVFIGAEIAAHNRKLAETEAELACAQRKFVEVEAACRAETQRVHELEHQLHTLNQAHEVLQGISSDQELQIKALKLVLREAVRGQQ